MKKGLVFILGLITGVILTMITLFVISKEYSKETGPAFNMSEQQIPFITATKFKIFQVADNGALANCEENISTISSFTGPVVFIPSDGDNQFYDDQIIEVPKNKKVMQVGTFRYLTRLGEKVVPVIKFM